MKRTRLLVVAAVVLVTVVGCAPGPNELVDTGDEEGDVAGFWLGVWHGIIAPVTFVVSLFSDTVHIYEVHNSGAWYNVGFLLGLAIVFGGGGRRAGRQSRRI